MRKRFVALFNILTWSSWFHFNVEVIFTSNSRIRCFKFCPLRSFQLWLNCYSLLLTLVIREMNMARALFGAYIHTATQSNRMSRCRTLMPQKKLFTVFTNSSTYIHTHTMYLMVQIYIDSARNYWELEILSRARTSKYIFICVYILRHRYRGKWELPRRFFQPLFSNDSLFTWVILHFSLLANSLAKLNWKKNEWKFSTSNYIIDIIKIGRITRQPDTIHYSISCQTFDIHSELKENQNMTSRFNGKCIHQKNRPKYPNEIWTNNTMHCVRRLTQRETKSERDKEREKNVNERNAQ